MFVLTFLFTPWGPIILLLAGALVLLPLNIRRLPRVVHVGTFFILLLSFLWVVGWRLSPVPIEHVLAIRSPLGVPFYISLRVSPEMWPFSVLVVLAGVLGALGMPLLPPAGYVSGPTPGLTLLAGALLITLADNLPALFLGWLLMDAAYMALLLDARPRMVSRLVVLILLGDLILWVVMIGTPRDMVIASWPSMALSSGFLGLLALSVWVRLGVYPLSRLPVMDVPGFPLVWLWVDVVAGASWLVRWLSLQGADEFLSHPAWWGIGGFAFFGSALVSWLTDDPALRRKWVWGQRVSAMVLLVVFGRADVRVALVLSTTAAILFTIPPLTTRPISSHSFISRLMYLLAILILWGVPWTLGQGIRLLLENVWERQPALGFILMWGDALVLASLLVGAVYTHEESGGGFVASRWCPAAIFLGGMLLGNVVVVWREGLRVANLLSPPTLIHTTLLPLTIGTLTAWQHDRIFANLQNWRQIFQRLTYLVPGETILRNAFRWLYTSLGGLLHILEGAGWFGWLSFLLLITLILKHVRV